MIEVRHILFAREKLIEAMWYLFCNKEASFKRFLIKLSDACTTTVNNEGGKKKTICMNKLLFVDSYLFSFPQH